MGSNEQKEAIVFISHSSKDREYILKFVGLVESCIVGITRESIVCTSISEYGIPVGENIYEYLRNKIQQDIYMIYIISPNYYRSAACLNEMGAGWILSAKQNVLAVPGFSIKDLQGAVNDGTIAAKMDEKTRIIEILELVSNHLDKKINTDILNRTVDNYIHDIQEIDKIAESMKKVEMNVFVKKKNKKKYQFIIRLHNPMDTARRCKKFVIYGKEKGKVYIQKIKKCDIENMILWPNHTHLFKVDIYRGGKKWQGISILECENEWEDML